MPSSAEDPKPQDARRAPNINPNLPPQRKTTTGQHTTEDYVEAIREGNRSILSQAITLVESTRPEHQEQARRILDACLPFTGDSIRVGITGVPGVGKSTFIETVGQRLVAAGRQLAVLAIDPTSERTKGSILGDKTRMDTLARRDDVFIRPSPTRGSLGGVARTTRETILLCEAAGFDTVFVETVGVGQSDVKVHSMVDVFLLLALTGAGDELQGIKRGIVEMADIIAINKADGANRAAAERAQAAYQQALQLLPPSQSPTPPVLTCSAQTGENIDAVWQAVMDHCERARADGAFDTRRRQQAIHWMYQTIEDRLQEDFFNTPAVQSALPEMEAQVESGTRSALAAAEHLLARYCAHAPDQGAD